ncbi:MAG: molybdate ABC transporter substrate-binding protein [Pseudomonadota bacterium]
MAFQNSPAKRCNLSQDEADPFGKALVMDRMRFFGLIALLASLPLQVMAAERLTVFAPSSLTDVMSAVTKAYEAHSGGAVVLSFAGSAQLARQVAAGAPADIIISAHPDWMNYLIENRAVDPKSVRIIAGNRLVIAVRREVENWSEPLKLLQSDRFAMGEPDSVPAGTYAREAMLNLGIWFKAKSQAVYGENVRVALFRLVRGEVGAAVVYESDLTLETGARVAYRFDPSTHADIRYVIAPVMTSRPKSSMDTFIDFLTGADGQAVFKEFGFLPLSEQQP